MKLKRFYGFAVALTLLLLTLCIVAAPAAADDNSAPSLPMQLYGNTVDGNGNPLPTGTVIIATVDGISSEYEVQEDGKIGGPNTFDTKFLINGKTSGNLVTFTINGVESAQKIPFEIGEVVEQQKLAFAVVIDKKDDDEKKEESGQEDDSGKKNEETTAGTGNGKSSGTDVPPETKSTLATPNPTAEPTPVPTQETEPTQGVSVASPVNQLPAQASTPAPFIGVLAGLGAAGVLFTLRRK